LKVHGSCHCGNVTYEALVDPARTGICHCTDCQQLTGSAYRVSVPAIEGSLQIASVQPAIYIKVGASGSRRAQAFCPNCGSPLYTYGADSPGAFVLRVGCIAERSQLVPTKQKWCRSALSWTQDLSGMERLEKE
jgi:hypothetical protein